MRNLADGGQVVDLGFWRTCVKMRRFNEIDIGYLQGPSWDLVNIYSREKFFNYYLGTSIPFAPKEKIAELQQDARFLEMSEYPYYGSVKKIDDCIVVRLG